MRARAAAAIQPRCTKHFSFLFASNHHDIFMFAPLLRVRKSLKCNALTEVSEWLWIEWLCGGCEMFSTIRCPGTEYHVNKFEICLFRSALNVNLWVGLAFRSCGCNSIPFFLVWCVACLIPIQQFN